MKKIIILLSFSISAAILVAACKKEESSELVFDKALAGSWSQTFDARDGMTGKHTFEFKADGTMELSVTGLQSPTGPELGYFTYTTAKYQTGGSKLTLVEPKEFRIPQNFSGLIPAKNQLVPATANYRPFNYAFSGDGKMLYLYPECGPLEDCVTFRLTKN